VIVVAACSITFSNLFHIPRRIYRQDLSYALLEAFLNNPTLAAFASMVVIWGSGKGDQDHWSTDRPQNRAMAMLALGHSKMQSP